MIVLDANILIRAILGQRVRHLLETYAARGVAFYAPDVAFADARKYLPALLHQRKKSDADLPAALRYLECMIEPIQSEAYTHFEMPAKQRLHARDEEDWPVLACALALNCAIWTEDVDFFGTGIAIWTTSRIEIFFQTLTQST